MLYEHVRTTATQPKGIMITNTVLVHARKLCVAISGPHVSFRSADVVSHIGTGAFSVFAHPEDGLLPAGVAVMLTPKIPGVTFLWQSKWTEPNKSQQEAIQRAIDLCGETILVNAIKETSAKIDDLLLKNVFTLERQLKCSRAAWKRMAKLTGRTTKKGIAS